MKDIYVPERSAWQLIKWNCRRCDSDHLYERMVTSSDGAHDDWQYHCPKCNYEWWVEGIDS